MPLYFRPRSKRPLSRRAQFALAFAALALALGVVAAWMAVGYYSEQSRNPNTQENSSSAPPTVEYTAEDTGNLLFILREEDICHYTLIQADPQHREMVAAALPGGLTDGNTTLAEALNKKGATKAASVVGDALELPVSHHMVMSFAQAENFLNYLENGVTLTLPQTIEFVDENGAKLQLKAGKQTLNAAQAVSLLRYEDWKDPADRQSIATRLVHAILNAYVREGRYFTGDFSTLANLCQTDLRIGDFTAWRETLEYLATANTDGTLCRFAELAGTTYEDQRFVPDMRNNRKENPLY